MGKILSVLISVVILSGCKYYGSALPPEYPMSMDNALIVANNRNLGTDGMERQIIRKPARPQINRPAYIPEKELAVVAPPKTMLVWTYPHVTKDNVRIFGSWSTIFLNDRYEWVLPANEVGDNTASHGG